MVWSWSCGSMGILGADIALESWLFWFQPCSRLGHLGLWSKWPNLKQFYSLKPQDSAWTIHRSSVNGLMLNLGFYGKNMSRYCIGKFVWILASFEIWPFTLPYLNLNWYTIQSFRKHNAHQNQNDHDTKMIITKTNGRVNCPCPENGQNPNSQPSSAIGRYLLQFYQQNLKIMTKPFTGFLWMGWLWSWGSMDRVEADRYCTWKLAVRILALFRAGAVYPIIKAFCGLCRYLSSWGTPPLSCINVVDNEVTWGGDSKYNIQIWCKQL